MAQGNENTMLRFTEQGINCGKNHYHHWLVGQPKPLFGGDCQEAFATGAELVYIRNNFDNLPFPAGANQGYLEGRLRSIHL